MLRIGINGFGRIGRAIFRINLDKKKFKIVAINDINPDIKNIAYQLNYDTIYDSLESKFQTKDNYLYDETHNIKVFQEHHIDKVNWSSCNVDIVIDASGVLDNVKRAKEAIKKENLKKILITHSPTEVDFTMVLGANEEYLDLLKQDVISSSICDATALGPVLKIIQDNFGIEAGYITTLHPWLNYQNLMDGPASSWSVPGEIYHHYALGRSAIGNIIPKPTSALDATFKVIPTLNSEIIGSFSYRTPTAIVGSADITLNLKNKASKKMIIEVFTNYEKSQKWKIIHNNIEPLVSLDFKKSEYSAIIDNRWTNIIQNKILKLVLWYDNEWGYASRVVDQLSYISSKLRK